MSGNTISPIGADEAWERFEAMAALSRKKRLEEAKSPQERTKLEEMYRTADALAKTSLNFGVEDLGGD